MDGGRYGTETLKPNRPIISTAVQGGVKQYYPAIGI
jgi:hypothetical protein